MDAERWWPIQLSPSTMAFRKPGGEAHCRAFQKVLSWEHASF